MTSKTSWFNSGIFTNRMKRFKWGSVLYFVILFFSVPFGILVRNYDSVNYARIYEKVPMILSSSYVTFPLFVAMVIPTVVAVLMYRNLHSPKQSIFEHGLPVTRAESYIANLAAGLSLMLLPVLANAAILLIMSFTGYGHLIALSDVIYWAALHVATIFVMYSVASATSFLTGNAAAHIGINVFVHVLPLLIALTIALISDVFLFGFVESENFIATQIAQYTPIVWIYSKSLFNYQEFVNVFTYPAMWIYIAGAVAVYGAGYILYRKRKVELAGDVAAFGIFRPIFKYTITAAVTVVMFSITNSVNMAAIYKYIVAFVGSVIAYFACEMLINKTVKVFRNYKGYIVFALCVAAFISFFAYTSVFGYETRVPELAEIESACIYDNYRYETPLIADSELITATQEIHREIIEDIPVVSNEGTRILRINYRLKNGNEMYRRYWVDEDIYDRAMTAMYDNSEYKFKVTGLDNINVENARELDINFYTSHYNNRVTATDLSRGDGVSGDYAARIMAAVKKDVETLSYKEMEKSYNWLNVSISLECSRRENEKYNIFKVFPDRGSQYDDYVESFNIHINSNYKNTYAILAEMGIIDDQIEMLSNNLYFLKLPVTVNNSEFTYKGQTGEQHEFNINMSDCVRIDKANAEKVAHDMLEKTRIYLSDGTYYYVYANPDFAMDSKTYQIQSMGSYAMAIPESNLPEFLKILTEN